MLIAVESLESAFHRLQQELPLDITDSRVASVSILQEVLCILSHYVVEFLNSEFSPVVF